MYPNNPNERVLTELDFVRLSKVDDRQRPDALAVKLNSADLVPSQEIAPDVITMYSQVELVFSESGLRQAVTLCYHADAEPARGFFSVLSPIGAALLGLRVGEIAHWPVPNGAPRSATVAAILFQPEASGDYTT